MDYQIGIYSITNTVNGKRYIGSSCNIKSRWQDHRKTLRANSHHSFHLQAAWNKYGEEVFAFERICKVWDPNNLTKVEQLFIDLYQASNSMFGYNICPQASSPLGVKRSPEWVEKMAVRFRGRRLTPEHRAALSASGKGRRKSPEHCRKIGDAQRGKPKPDISVRQLGENNPSAKLSADQVRQIRSLYTGHDGEYSQYKLADMFGVAVPTINNILKRKRWGWLD